MTNCDQEMCPNWTGDGDFCPCALFGIAKPCHVCGRDLGSNDLCANCEQVGGAS